MGRFQSKKALNSLVGRYYPYLAGLLSALISAGCYAGDVAVEFARLEAESANAWRVSVTLRHADTGWDHYADAWRVVTGDGSIHGWSEERLAVDLNSDAGDRFEVKR